MQCAVRGCKSNSSDVSGQYTFHQFPRNLNLRKQWMVNTGIEIVTKDTKICNLHFKDTCFYYNIIKKLKLLSMNAVPTIFPFTSGTSKAAIPTVIQVQEPKVVLEQMDPLEESRYIVKPVSSPWQGPTLLIQPLTVLQENNPYSAICRACLATDCKMFPLTEETLKWYENLTGLQLCEYSDLPKWLCSECHQRLINVNKFKTKSLKAHKLLLDVFHIHDVINKSTIKTVDRQANSLVSSLQKGQIEILEIGEANTEPEVQDNHEFSNYDCLEEPEVQDSNEFSNYEFLEDDLNYNNTVDENVINNYQELPIDHDYAIKDYNYEVINDDPDEVMEMDDDDIPLQSVENVQESEYDVLPHVKKIDNRMSKKKNITADKEVDGFTITSLSFEEQVEELEKKKHSRYYNKKLSCETCHISCSNQAQLDRHKKKHTDECGGFICEVCKLHFKYKKDVLNHLANHHLYKYSCSHCNFATINRPKAKRHSNFHKGGEYRCAHCPEIFTFRDILTRHLQRKHPSSVNMREHFCVFCGRRCLTIRAHLNHVNTKHVNDTRTVPEDGPFCEICDVRFLNEEAYNNHMKCSFKHGTNESKVWVDRDPVTGNKKQKSYTLDYYMKCIKCDRQYGNAQSYRKHLLKRHPEHFVRQRPLRKVKQKTDRQEKTNSRDNNTPRFTQKSFMCDRCGKTFVNAHQLQYHSVVHTGEKPYKCDECGKGYPNPSALKEHKLKHKGQCFACDICNRQFSTYSNLGRHRRTHTGLRPYKCILCEKSFKSKAEQKSHMDHIHLQVPWPTRKRQRREDATKRTPIVVVPELPKRPRYKELIKNIEGPEM